MIDHTLREDLQAVYNSEVYGAVTFATARTLSLLSSRKRHMFKCLGALERETRRRALEAASGAGLRLSFPFAAVPRGVLAGAGLAVLPWSYSMKKFVRSTALYLDEFRAMERAHPGEQASLFAFVVQHEEALHAFARAERARSGESLTPVETLIAV